MTGGPKFTPCDRQTDRPTVPLEKVRFRLNCMHDEERVIITLLLYMGLFTELTRDNIAIGILLKWLTYREGWGCERGVSDGNSIHK